MREKNFTPATLQACMTCCNVAAVRFFQTAVGDCATIICASWKYKIDFRSAALAIAGSDRGCPALCLAVRQHAIPCADEAVAGDAAVAGGPGIGNRIAIGIGCRRENVDRRHYADEPAIAVVLTF